jgi:hypothetical protein
MSRLFVMGIAVALVATAGVVAADPAAKRKVTPPRLSGMVLKSSDAAAKRKVTDPSGAVLKSYDATAKRKVTDPSSGIAIPIIVPIFP